MNDTYLCIICGRLHPVGFSHDEIVDMERSQRDIEEENQI